jgi:hypothetical protein
MSPNSASPFNAPLDDHHDLDSDVQMDIPHPASPNASLGSGNPEDIQDEAILFNLDDNGASDHPNPPQATLESLANTQRIIEQIQGASFDDEEHQWSADEFISFLHPPNEQFCVDDPQLRLSLSIYVSLSAHSSEATYEAVRRSITDLLS